ncbi:uncharacterized protein (DUF736 family) [Bradyrhizobium japonicum]|uniref:DUF736 domain-containing protein n=1 Tax=Bradyrhizobium liaoningense TaxID=43992 RepID=UPI001BA8FFA6|nr:DUF736 domain-containing protein [Bradyrhizobium liaoningense]MBR1070205.1 DUF736 domain-containing protein [Bradyrhizobium liaoningense]
MIIGNFTYYAHQNAYAGEIATLTVLRTNVKFLPTEKTGDKEPDYRIVHEFEGMAVELGAAWTRNSDRGRHYLSVMLDDPALPTPINAALFPSTENEQAALVWQRQAKKPPVTEAKPASPRARKSSGQAPRPS